MDSLMQKKPVPVTRSVMDAREEYVLSGDFVLPEYCPDVAVVLKCAISPRVQSRQWNGNQLTLDGVAVVRVLYLDEERQHVRAAEFSQPLSCTLQGGGQPERAPVQVTLTPEYANCRATSPRRLEVRGAFQIHACAESAGEEELLEAADGDGLYTRQTQATACAPRASAEKLLSVNEVLDFDAGLPEAEQLLWGDCSAAVLECKLLTGKAIVKGQLHIHSLYTDDSVNGTVYPLHFTVPFSQILDLDGAEEGMPCVACVSVLSDTLRIAPNIDGKNAALEVAAKLLVQCQLYSAMPVSLVLDAYCTDCPVELETRDLALPNLVGVRYDTATVQRSVELPADDLTEILDVWVQPQGMSGSCADGTAALTGKMTVSMLVRDRDGAVAYYERPEEYRLEYPTQGTTVQAECAALGTDYSVVSGKLELRVTLAVSMTERNRSEYRVVQQLTPQTEQAYPAETAAIKIYYADPGESVWDIARECHTSPTGICRENGVTDGTLAERTMLIVPII